MKTQFILRLFFALSILLAALFLPASSRANAQQSCQFVFGFAAFHALAPTLVGQCTANEVHDTAGNGYQQTGNGTLIWEKATNRISFTNGYMTWVNSPPGLQARLATQRFAWEGDSNGLPVVADGAGESAQTYLDDRSNEYALMLSLANALNRREYVRAYSYWEPDSAQLPSLEEFQRGYANTGAVSLMIGLIRQEPAAGNRFSTVPVVLSANTLDGQTQTFVGCFTLHLAVPAIQATPPFRGWAIRSADVNQVPNDSDKASLLNTACPTSDVQPLTPQPFADPADVSATRYLDDRSTAQELLRSFANALNRKEYLRAYSYWEPNASQLQTFADFEKGYANTEAVSLTLGAVTGEAGAGQRYYSVPVLLTATLSGGSTQTFAGCYELHLSEPHIQGAAPFQPLAIRSATVQQVAPGTPMPSC